MTVVPQSTGRPVILLADTDREYLRLLGSLLQESCTVRATHSAERALHAMTTHPLPDLVLLGINDPALHALPQETILPIPKPVHAFSLLSELRRRLPGRLPAPAGKLAQRRALVVEDDALMQQVIVETLGSHAVSAAVAANGTAALAMLERERFDWILMDMQMPVMDGLATTRAIRADPRRADQCIIALSGSDGAAEREACRAAGMNDFLSKPVAPAPLWDKLAEWLEADRREPSPEKVGARSTAPATDFDFTTLDALAQGEPQRIEKYARHFMSSVSTGMVLIGQALAGDDLAQARREAHKLKSAARWVGAHALGEHFAALENSPADPATARRLADACSEHYATLRHALEDHLAGVPPASTTIPSP